MMRQEPAGDCASSEDDNQVCPLATPDHVGSAGNRFVRRAMRGHAEISDQFIDGPYSAQEIDHRIDSKSTEWTGLDCES
jgi:hypothetical protein